jgi:citrate lyase subunit beta/citryl-CoA lyase
VTSPVRSWLYVPGHQPERALKAVATDADAVDIDLEDAVPADRKDEARSHTVDLLRGLPEDRPQVWVRINPPSTPWGERDLADLSGVAVDGVRLPRAEDPSTVRAVAEALGCPLQLLVESARGLLAARELAVADPCVRGIGLGEADLAADLRVGAEGLAWARGWIVAVSRAAGLASPVQSVYTAVSDVEGLRATTTAGRQQGFFGRSVVHPRQIVPVHEAYRPSAEETERARAVVEASAAARTHGEVAVLTADGRFVDPAVVAQAELVLELASLTEPTRHTADNPSEENP